MTEYEYYTNSPYTNYCKAEGWKQQNEAYWEGMRLGFYRIHQSLVEKPISIHEFWPIGEAPEPVKLVLTDEMRDHIKKVHGLK